MFDTGSRGTLRAMYFEAWARARAGLPLTPLDSQIVDVVNDHPEYHAALADTAIRDADFDDPAGTGNPFLHMGLHLAVRDQIATDRPAGIRALFERIRSQSPSAHAAEHRTLECLFAMLREAQSSGVPPDEARYLAQLRRSADRARGGSSRS